MAVLRKPGSWEKPDPADVLDLSTDEDWQVLLQSVSVINDLPWKRCLEVARSNGARTVVIETRYIDIDYRSEYSAFFSKTFPEIPDTARRYHFFGSQLSPSSIWDLPEEHDYLGYVITRPTELGFVGRTMLKPPPEAIDHVTCLATDTINFFGQQLEVTGFPFVQQDTQLGRCAHAASWMCHYAAALKGETWRRPMADFGLLAEHSVGPGRPVPSSGLTGLQISNLMREFGLPPILYNMDALPEHPKLPDADPGTRAVPILCRYLNSGIPVLVGTHDHAFVVLGYERVQNPREDDWFKFVRHDDQRGPYRWIDDINTDFDADVGHSYGNWRMLLASLPDKLWLLPEAAERTARTLLPAIDKLVKTDPNVSRARSLADLNDQGRLTYRTYAIEANEYKASALSRRLGSDAGREIRLARLSRLLWIVEAVDRQRRRSGGSAVMGEVLFDATSSDIRPKPLAIRVPGAMVVFGTDESFRYPIPATDRAVRSAASVQP